MQLQQFKTLLSARKLLYQSSEHANLTVKGAYAGFDPTANSLHIGNLIPILGLVLCGHNNIPPFALIGSATTLIGDPTGRTSAKSILTHSEIANNALFITTQIERIYLKAMALTKYKNFSELRIVDNLSWFKNINFIDFLAKIGRHAKVKSMLARNCVQTRLNSDDGLTYCELSYQLMQGYDYLHLHKTFGVNMQIGGSDQWGNMVSGMDFIRKQMNVEAGFITLPLLTTADGAKMGKSSKNGIWLSSEYTCIYDFYQYFVSLSDSDAFHIFPLLNILGTEVAEELMEQHVLNPSSHHLQKFLAHYITSLIHDENLANQVVLLSRALFSLNESAEIENIQIEKLLDRHRLRKINRSIFQSDSTQAGDFFKIIFSEFSKSQIKNMINSGGVKINYEKIFDFSQIIHIDKLPRRIILNFGKSSFYIIDLLR